MGANAFTDSATGKVADFPLNGWCSQSATAIADSMIYTDAVSLVHWKEEYRNKCLPLPLKIIVDNDDSAKALTDFAVQGKSREGASTAWHTILTMFDLSGTPVATLAATLESTLYWSGLTSPDDLIRVGVTGAAGANVTKATITFEVG